MPDEQDDIPDRTRRRLLQLTVYVPAAVLSLSALRGNTARADVTGGVKIQLQASTTVKTVG